MKIYSKFSLSYFTLRRISYILDWLCFLAFPLILLFKTGQPHSYRHMLDWGVNALLFLKIIVFMKPILVAIGHPRRYKLLHFRRHLGIVTFWFAIFHALGIMILRGWRNINQYVGLDNYLFRGILATIVMLFLGFTTNYFSIKKLGPWRKRIQYLTYPALFLTMIHQAMMPFVLATRGYHDMYNVGYVFLLFVFAKTIEYLITHKKLPSLWTWMKE